MKAVLIALTALLCLSDAAVAQAPSADDNLTRSRAVEAVVWGMPAANYDLMLQPALKAGAKENEIIYWSRPVDWHNQTLTPNPDALYFMIFFNTKQAGPIVIDVPPADDGSFAANIDTVWQMPLEDAGTYGADKGAGGKYLILPPGYTGGQPDGYIAVRSETFAGYALFRSNSQATARPISPKPPSTASGSKSIRCRRPRILRKRSSLTPRTSSTTPLSPTI